MRSDLERTTPDRKPAKLPWSKPEARVMVRLHRECPAITTLRAHLRNNVRSAQYEQRLHDAYVKQQADPEDRQPYPQAPLPWVVKVITPPDHMNHPRNDCHHREQDVGEMPYLVAHPQLGPPQRHHNKCDQRISR